MGWCLYWMIIEVFSNCNDSAILWKDRGAWITTLCSPWNECHVSWQPHGPGKLFRQSNWDHWSLQELLSPGTRSGPMPHCFSFLMLFVSFTSKLWSFFHAYQWILAFKWRTAGTAAFHNWGSDLPFLTGFSLNLSFCPDPATFGFLLYNLPFRSEDSGSQISNPWK